MKLKRILGWTGVSVTLLISGIWAYWGAFENFHEGWYKETLWENLFLMFFQYLIFSFVFMALALIGLKLKKTGLALHISVCIFCLWFFSGANFSVLGLLIVIPFLLLGLLYYFGEPYPVKWATRLVVFVPLVIIAAISIPQAVKVSKRIDDGNYSTRTIEGNGVTLLWAPKGPGRPDRGVTWEEANNICKYLSEDGKTIMDTEQNIWRLPTVDELVRSMSLHNENAGGVWYPEEEKAVYELKPDKESPLWVLHSKVIYYWTADTCPRDEGKAYIVVYDGGVYPRSKINSFAYLSFRAVRNIE